MLVTSHMLFIGKVAGLFKILQRLNPLMMRHKTNSNPINRIVIQVKYISAGAAWNSRCQPNAYHIWVPQEYSTHVDGSLCILSPRTVSDHKMQSTAGYSISFSEEAILVLRCQHLQPFGAVSSLASGERVAIADAVSHRAMVGTLEKMMEESGRQNACGTGRNLALLKILIVQISRQYALRKAAAHISAQGRIVERFTQLLCSQDCARHAVKRLADELAISPMSFNAIIRNTLGDTPGRLVQHSLLQKAKHAAMHSQESMKEVAARLGFSDMAHFSKFFSAGAGMTFTDFKRTYQHF